MFGKYIKNLLLYDYILKLKPLWISHVIVLGIIACETGLLVSIINCYFLNAETVNNHEVTFEIYVKFSQTVYCILVGFCTLILHILNLIISLLLKKRFITKSRFLTQNKYYNWIWTLSTYYSFICVFLYFYIR